MWSRVEDAHRGRASLRAAPNTVFRARFLRTTYSFINHQSIINPTYPGTVHAVAPERFMIHHTV